MASRLDCQVEDDSPVTVVRLRGSLDLTTTRPVHAALQRCLADQPDALVVDLTTVRVEERLALSVFAAVARQAAIWPEVPVVVCGPTDDTADWLAATSAGRRVAVRRDCAAAIREATRRSAAPRLRAHLEPVSGACRRARELASEACQRWNLPDLAGPTRLVLSEFVGNVVRHAGTPMDVTLTLRRPFLHVAVADGSQGAVLPGNPHPRAEGGRGLLLVRELAQRWGSLPIGDGKVVWAVLPAH
ncbi:ATP-binding protein [Solwaraspora sp. WMMD1047]|uniref:ATP-binding protein n=1 Tax=Solwaraspora sp. WMMD1047 TaxID=3016102 RepID=UPI002416E193|nr:ATP-binding protein [Solwaraspora sp. WMMD1047]MDG4831271.1 ATP-binding protein [Solwaraspora sp. WMMD1047]